jgi:hypothetical protein
MVSKFTSTRIDLFIGHVAVLDSFLGYWAGCAGRLFDEMLQTWWYLFSLEQSVRCPCASFWLVPYKTI